MCYTSQKGFPRGLLAHKAVYLHATVLQSGGVPSRELVRILTCLFRRKKTHTHNYRLLTPKQNQNCERIPLSIEQIGRLGRKAVKEEQRGELQQKGDGGKLLPSRHRHSREMQWSKSKLASLGNCRCYTQLPPVQVGSACLHPTPCRPMTTLRELGMLLKLILQSTSPQLSRLLRSTYPVEGVLHGSR